MLCWLSQVGNLGELWSNLASWLFHMRLLWEFCPSQLHSLSRLFDQLIFYVNGISFEIRVQKGVMSIKFSHIMTLVFLK